MQLSMKILRVVCMATSILAFKLEPQCSKFSYEESVLEKMIRTEIKFEELIKHVELSLNELNDKYGKLKEDTDRSLDHFKQINDETSTEHKAHVAEVDNALAEIGKLKDDVAVPTVVFHAKTVEDKTLNADQTIVFIDVLYNYGEGYDKSTGIFTSPVKGTYMFSAHLCPSANKRIHYGFIVEGTLVTNGKHIDVNSALVCTSFDVVVHLKAGERVWVQSRVTGDELVDDIYRWNSFSGALFHK